MPDCSVGDRVVAILQAGLENILVDNIYFANKL